jgi:hypothetical protein
MPRPDGFFVPALAALVAAGVALTNQAASAQSSVETLRPVAALPAHIAGTFQHLTSCQQTADGVYFIFDRRAHAVYTAGPALDSARKLIEIGTEPGRVLDPTAFDLAQDGTFMVADAPRGQPRIQLFLTSGTTLGSFYLQGTAQPRIVIGNLVMSGVAAVEYTGKAVYVNQPESGALITEYSLAGAPLRSFGDLRRTGHEGDPTVHLALNAGLVIARPDGGFYFVFLAGVPAFRKYDAAGRLLFERHVEGSDLDAFVLALPTTWPRQKGEGGELPVVVPSILAAGSDRNGGLWISLTVGKTYVYDATGERRRIVEFRGAGPISPTSLSFTPNGRLLVAPGCYAFAT